MKESSLKLTKKDDVARRNRVPKFDNNKNFFTGNINTTCEHANKMH